MDSSYFRNNRIEEALNMRNMKQIDLCEKTGLRKSSVNGWIKQNWQPKQNALYLMAKALNVSEMWLAGYDVPMERSAQRIESERLQELAQELTSNKKYLNIMSLIVQLDDSQLSTVEMMLKGLVKE